jgi:hypothetical protein
MTWNGETVNGLSVQIIISSVHQFWSHVNSVSHLQWRLSLTLTRTLLFHFRRRQRRMRQEDHRPPIEWHARGVRKIVTQLMLGFYCNQWARRRVQRDFSHSANRRGLAIGWRCATRAQRAGRAETHGAARVNGSESLRATWPAIGGPKAWMFITINSSSPQN